METLFSMKDFNVSLVTHFFLYLLEKLKCCLVCMLKKQCVCLELKWHVTALVRQHVWEREEPFNLLIDLHCVILVIFQAKNRLISDLINNSANVIVLKIHTLMAQYSRNSTAQPWLMIEGKIAVIWKKHSWLFFFLADLCGWDLCVCVCRLHQMFCVLNAIITCLESPENPDLSGFSNEALTQMDSINSRCCSITSFAWRIASVNRGRSYFPIYFH